MTVREHVLPIPSDDELARLVGAATPHFAMQIRERIAQLAAELGSDDPRLPALEAHMERLEVLATGGEPGAPGQAELPTRPSLTLG